MNHLPKLPGLAATAKFADKSIHFSPVLIEVAQLEKVEVYPRLKTRPQGLSEEEAASRLAEVGPNVVAAGRHRGWPWRLLNATRNPLVILLTVLAAISFATGDARAGTVMALMVTLGVLLRFVQDGRADAAAERLKAMTAAVESAHVFARLSPAHKQRIIRALQRRGHVVGFMGDGINDAPALHVADVGICSPRCRRSTGRFCLRRSSVTSFSPIL